MRSLLLALLIGGTGAGACGARPVLAQAALPPLPAGVPAATSTPPLTLVQVLDLAHHANPTLLSAAEHLSAVRALETTAALRQNPSAILGSQMATLQSGDPNGTSLFQAGVQRLFERGNKRALRVEAARAGTAVAGSQLADLRRQVDLAVRQAFARMVFAKAALAVAEDNLAGYRQTVALMQVRLDAGDVDRTDFERVEVQLAGFEADRDAAELVLRQGSIALQTLLGVARPTNDFAVTGSLEPPATTETLEELRTQALKNRPDLAAAEEQVTANESAVRLAQANGTADPTLEAEYERSGHANTVGGNLNLPLRIFDKNQGEKERTRYELESSRLAVVGVRNQVISDVDTAWAAYQTARALSTRYRSKYLAEAAHVRDNLQFSYRNGNSTLLDYLSALGEYRQVNLSALNADLQLLLSVEQLRYAAHTEIVP